MAMAEKARDIGLVLRHASNTRRLHTASMLHTRPCYAKSSYRSVEPQTLHGNVHQVDHVPNGPTNSAAITTVFPLRLCGGKLLVAVTRERRYGPSRLRVNDDDDPTRGPVQLFSGDCVYGYGRLS